MATIASSAAHKRSVVVFVLSLAATVAAGAQAASRGDQNQVQRTGCIALAALQAPAGSKAPAPAATDSRQDLGPITEREVSLLIRALEPVESKAGGRTAPIFAEKTELSLPRAQILSADVAAVLSQIHARELMKTLAGRRDIKPQARGEIERMLKSMAPCAEAHFADRGGKPAFDQSLQIIERNRPALENMLLRSLDLLRPAGPPPTGGQR